MGRSDQTLEQLSLRNALLLTRRGKDGRSAYAAAVAGGYTGTEEDYNRAMAALGGMRVLSLTGETAEGDVSTYYLMGADEDPEA